MTLFKLKSAPLILIEDDENKNTLPLLRELVHDDKNLLQLFCYEQPISHWQSVFSNKSNKLIETEFKPDLFDKYTSKKCIVVIDSVNQMALTLGWNESLKCIRKLHNHSEVSRLVLILHKDCLSFNSKLQIHLNHIASAIVSFDSSNFAKVIVQLKKSGKLIKSEEVLCIEFGVLKLKPVIKVEKKEDEVEKPLPSNLSTFKIEVEQTDKIEKYKLKLPYMSKINEGEGKVYYEPDAVDDWDEEDPDEDLDI